MSTIKQSWLPMKLVKLVWRVEDRECMRACIKMSVIGHLHIYRRSTIKYLHNFHVSKQGDAYAHCSTERQTVGLSETTEYYGRTVVLAKSNRDINYIEILDKNLSNMNQKRRSATLNSHCRPEPYLSWWLHASLHGRIESIETEIKELNTVLQ
jgi:hypothetical protein